jgi:hypothetical protein
VEYCATEKMLADFFTKPLQGQLFNRARDLIMNTANIVGTQKNDATMLYPAKLHRSVLANKLKDNGKTDVKPNTNDGDNNT